MAVYINNVRHVNDPARPYGDAAIIDYFVDTDADIASLPGIDTIGGGSTAYIITTGKVRVLTETGWDKEL